MKIFLCASDSYAYELAGAYHFPILISYVSANNKKAFMAVYKQHKRGGRKNVNNDGE